MTGNKHTLPVHVLLGRFHALQNTWELLSLNESNFPDVLSASKRKWQMTKEIRRGVLLGITMLCWRGCC
jgi:hypothetical protein